MSAKPLPEGAPRVIPMLVCRDPGAEADFCKAAFRAEERVRRPAPDGSVAHVLVTIGTAMVMIEGVFPTYAASRAPEDDASSPVVLYVYIEDVDQAVVRAVAAGAKVLIPVADQFWGDRTGRIIDPSGHVWIVATRIEETTAEERQKRWSDTVEGKKA